MRILSFSFLFFYLVHVHANSNYTRLDFPAGFVFGAGNSAYQVEGAASEDGRKPSVWDTYTHQERNIVKGTGDIASDQYHKYKDDVKLMYEMGLDAYRFSISWSRLIPDGRGVVNPLGLKYYNDLIDELVGHGIQPHVTLSHFDLPQALQDEYEGFLSAKFIEDFTAYAEFCFLEFGDRVKSWITFNEPNTQFGFTRCFSPFDPACSNGDAKTKTYLPAHNILLSHAAVVHIYRTNYQEKQKGKIGITLLGIWYEPLTDSPLDYNEAKRQLAFFFDWFLEPLVYGRYSTVMRKSLGFQLPNFTKEESKKMTGSFDFIGLNHYYGLYVQGDKNQYRSTSGLHDYLVNNNGSFGPSVQPKILLDTPTFELDLGRLKQENQYVPAGVGLKKLLLHLKIKYKNPTVFLHENGYPTSGDDSLDPVAQNDTGRIWFLDEHIKILLLSIRNGSNVKGYFVWSFIDSFELFGGYTAHFGLYGVDFNDKNRRRYPRQSAHWFSTTFLAKTRNRQETELYSQ